MRWPACSTTSTRCSRRAHLVVRPAELDVRWRASLLLLRHPSVVTDPSRSTLVGGGLPFGVGRTPRIAVGVGRDDADRPRARRSPYRPEVPVGGLLVLGLLAMISTIVWSFDLLRPGPSDGVELCGPRRRGFRRGRGAAIPWAAGALLVTNGRVAVRHVGRRNVVACYLPATT